MKTPAPPPQHARLSLRIGKRAKLTAEVSVTPIGLLSVGALVSAILLSSAVVVKVGRRSSHPGPLSR